MFNMHFIVQVAVALVVFAILNNAAIKIMKLESLVDDPTKLVKTVLFKGWVETNGFTNKQYNTHNVFSTNYQKLPHSMNKMGGAQFSYTLWVKLNDLSASNVADKVLFLHGDKNRYAYTTSVGNLTQNHVGNVVKCPLVKFGDSADTLMVEFNTTTEVSATAEISKVKSFDETIRHNVFSLMPGKWVLFTFTFEDDRRYGEHEDGVVFKFYVNDILYHTQRYAGALRLNQGDLSILPTVAIADGYLADLTYYNYALELDAIKNVVRAGPSKIRYNDLAGDPSFNQPLYLSQYNKLEIANL